MTISLEFKYKANGFDIHMEDLEEFDLDNILDLIDEAMIAEVGEDNVPDIIHEDLIELTVSFGDEEYSIDKHDLEYWQIIFDEDLEEDILVALHDNIGCWEAISKIVENSAYIVHDSIEDYVHGLLSDFGIELPSWLCVDEKLTYSANLRHDCDTQELDDGRLLQWYEQ